MIADGSLGAISWYEATWDRFRPQVVDRWKERAASGGGVLLDLGTHLIDQALCLFGMPEWVQADVFAQRVGAAVDDGFEILMGSGALRIRLGANSVAANHASRYRIHAAAGSYLKSGMDVQEAQLREGVLPENSAFGEEPRSHGDASSRLITRLKRSFRGARKLAAVLSLVSRQCGVGRPHSRLDKSCAGRAEDIEAARQSAKIGCRIKLSQRNLPE